MDIMLNDARTEFHIICAALQWEADEGILTEVGKNNLVTLSSPGFKYIDKPIDGHSDHVSGIMDVDICIQLHKYISSKISGLAKGGINASAIADRIDETGKRFKWYGYREYFAGHEYSIRFRIFDLTNTETVSELRGADVSKPIVQKMAAYYMAFTDFLPPLA
jgi:hypothetical protein